MPGRRCTVGIILLAGSLLSACRGGSIVPPPPVPPEGMAIVLLQLTATMSGGPVVFLDALLDEYAQAPFRIAIENIDTGPRTWHKVQSPASAAAAQGWIYLVLAPGRYHASYYLRIRAFAVSEEFFLLVPGDRRLVYAGSLAWTCIGFPGSRYILRCRAPATLRDESAAARAAADAWFPALGTPVTELMRQTGS